MKSRFLLSMAVAAVVMAGCSNEDELLSGNSSKVVLKASVEKEEVSSRVAFTESDFAFYWSAGDLLGVGTSEFSQFKLTDGAGKATGSFTGYGTVGEYAVYPHSNNHKIEEGSLKYYFRESDTYSTVDTDYFTTADGSGQSWNPPMFGKVENGEVYLNHLGAVFCVKISPMPVTEGRFTFTATNNMQIAGEYSTSLSSIDQGIQAIPVTEKNKTNNTVTINFSGLTKTNEVIQDGVFYIPVPVGTYKFRIEVFETGNDTPELSVTSDEVSYEMPRRRLQAIRLNKGTLEAGGQTTANDLQTAVGKLSTANAVTAVSEVSGENTVNLPEFAGKAKSLTLQDVASETKLTINEASDNSSPQEFTLSIPEKEADDTALDLIINMPHTTATLAANNATATYGNVTSTTAQNTLIIDKGVTVSNLKVMAGNVRVRSGATLSDITRDESAGIIYVYKEQGATVNDPSTPDDNIIILDTIIEEIMKGGTVEVNTPFEGTIDFNGIDVATDLTLKLNAKVDVLKLGGNNANAADDVAPAIKVVVANGIAYPNIQFNENTRNLTLEGNAASSKTLDTALELKSGKNITISNIKFGFVATVDNAYTIEAASAIDGLTVQNCVVENLGQRFVFVDSESIKNVTIQDNTIICLDGSRNSGPSREMDAIYVAKADGVTIKGNTITNSMDHHAIYVDADNKSDDITITENTIKNAHEDAIKVDNPLKVTITNNTVDAQLNGIRVDNFEQDATVVVTGNTISAGCVETDEFGINLKKGSVNVALTAKENKIGENGIKNSRYFNAASTLNLSGDYANPILIAEGVSITSDAAYGILNEKGLQWVQQKAPTHLFKNKEIRLMDDITLAEAWTPINAWHSSDGECPMNGSTINGNNKKIINMNVKGESSIGFIGSCSSDITIKDLTFENPNVESSASFIGTVIGYQYGNVTMNNVKVTNGTLKSTAEKGIRIGGLVGYSVSNDGAKLNLTDCGVSGTSITGFHNLGGLVGTVNAENKATFTNCSSNNNTFTYGADNLQAWHDYDSNAYAVGLAEKNNCTTSGNKAVNSYGVTYTASNKTYELTTKESMFWFARQVNENKHTFSGEVVSLKNDIDLDNELWTPIGQTGKTTFKGMFDGQGFTISNLNINNTDESANCSTALFGWIESHGEENVTVKNVTVNGATVTGHHYVAVIVGYVYGMIDNCHVTNATISCTSVNDDANGDKCGTIAGYVGEDAIINKCTASASTISAGRDAGQIVGAAKEACVTECSASTDVTVSANGTSTSANINNTVIGRKL